MRRKEQQELIASLKQKYNLPDEVRTLKEIQDYLDAQNDIIDRGKRAVEQGVAFMDGYFDQVKPEILDKIYEVFEMGPSKNKLMRMTKQIPLGAILTFGGMNDILSDAKTLEKEVSHLKEYFWDRGLTTPQEIATGVTKDNKKVTGGYYSSRAAAETGGDGDVIHTELSKYPDAYPYAYGRRRNLDKIIENYYTEIRNEIQNASV